MLSAIFFFTAVLKKIDGKLNMEVLSGILSALFVGEFYNRHNGIRLPPHLAFFGDKRFVPLATEFSMLCF